MPSEVQVEALRTSGKGEEHRIPKAEWLQHIHRLIHAETVDTVNLRDGRVMLVNDNGYATRAVESGPRTTTLVPTRALLPFNEEATRLYHSICIPGTTHRIVGDVAIIRDADLED